MRTFAFVVFVSGLLAFAVLCAAGVAMGRAEVRAKDHAAVSAPAGPLRAG